MDIPKFETKKELFEHLYKNKARIMAQKRAVTKFADGFSYINGNMNGPVMKANVIDNELQIKAVINSTLLFDSHKDLHLNKLWNKSLNGNYHTILNKQHGQSFEDVIAEGDEIKVSAVIMPWKSLGFNYEGTTQALIYDATLQKETNPYMFKKYKEGKVRNHSVEMQYVKYTMAINDADYKEEFAEWEKWIDYVANKQDAIDSGFMFPVYEAKHLGGAAVTRGSNFATPTLENNKTEPLHQGTPNEPVEATHKNILLNFIN